MATVSNTAQHRLGFKVVPTFLLLCFGYLSLWAYSVHHYPGGDPDRFYHYAVSKASVAQGLLETIPQVEDLGWGKYFYEKEFLFHVITRVGYQLGAEHGVDISSWVIGFLVFFLLYLFVGLRAGWLYGALLVIGLGLMNPYFSPRMVLVRPHLLGVLSFIILAVGVVEEKMIIAAVGGFLFGESYHGFFVPVIFLTLSHLVSLYYNKSKWNHLSKTVFFGLLGLASGYFINPYFPGNLIMGIEHLQIALFHSKPEAGVTPGGELYPLSMIQNLIAFGICWIAVAIMSIRFFFDKKTVRAKVSTPDGDPFIQ